MSLPFHLHKWFSGRVAAAASIGFGLIAGPAMLAQSALEAPEIVRHSIDLGSAPATAEKLVTVHLKPHNEAAYNKAVEDLYNPASPTYHHWFTSADFAKYAPTTAEIATVKGELASHGLAVVDVDANHFSIRARGTSANLERAFQTQIHQISHNGKTLSANIAPARLTGGAGDLVRGVTGLTSFKFEPHVKFPINPKTGKRRGAFALTKANAGSFNPADYFTNSCFRGKTSVTLTTEGAALPYGKYSGIRYDQGNKICGWTPAQVQSNYGYNAAYLSHLSGEGQTVVIVEGPIDPTQVVSDAVSFNTLFGLPAFTKTNLQVYYSDGVPNPIALQNESFDGEAQLDIEWVHSIAPAAKIVVLITPTQDWTEFEYAIQLAVDNKLGNVISNSYGYPEGLFGAHTVAGFEQVLQSAAAAGIAVNFSTGDGGDEGFGSPTGGGESYPSSSAFVTAVGGTSIGIPTPSGFGEVGWGNNLTFLSYASNAVEDPIYQYGFVGGAGGGESIFIPKPSWQKSLPGVGRQEPDIAAVADPYTGALVVADGEIGPFGGTSLSTPIFSAVWALANQKAGKSLGQAAPLIPRLPADAIHDTVPIGNADNVTGSLTDSKGTTNFTAISILPPLEGTTTFVSALWDVSGNSTGEYAVFSFGTDTSLQTSTGWDNVTGYGVPRGLHFILDAAALK